MAFPFHGADLLQPVLVARAANCGYCSLCHRGGAGDRKKKERKKGEKKKNPEGGGEETSSTLYQRVNDLLITCFSLFLSQLACLSACNCSVRDVTSRLRAWHTGMSGGPADSRRHPHQFGSTLPLSIT